MWKLANRTRFATERTFARDRDGAEVLLVVIKATFTIEEDGALSVAKEQPPPARTPLHTGIPATTSLLDDGDFALTKSNTDVLLIGHARTIDDTPSIAVEVRCAVGDWSKHVTAIGDRRWRDGLTGFRLGDPEPFTRMPLVYERAFGGVDPSSEAREGCDANPVGVGFLAASSRPIDGARAPNLEDRDDLMTDPHARPRPMCFGPIARAWPLRRRLAGTYDERWHRERRPLVPLDFDDAFWQAAPLDQRLAIRGGEPVELLGVSPRGALRFDLPRLGFMLRTRLGGRKADHGATLHTLRFEPDHRRVTLVFQSALPCHDELETLERTVVEEVDGAP